MVIVSGRPPSLQRRIRVNGRESFRVGDVVHSSLGKAKIGMPVYKEGNFIEYSTDMVDVDIAILLGLDMMKQLRWYVNEVTNEFFSNEDKSRKIPLCPKQGHLYLQWSNSIVLFTRHELVKFHRRFAHSSTDKLANVLRRAPPGNYTPTARRFLDDIFAHCNSCQHIAPKPFVFQVTMPDDIVFNHEIFMDLM